MNSNLVLKIKKRTQPEYLIMMVVLLPFLFGVCYDIIGFSAALYLIDFAVLFLSVLIVLNLNRKRIDINRSHKFIYLIPICFMLITFVVYIFNYQSILYYFWGFRNNFRYYFAFFAFITFIGKKDIDFYLKIFDNLFWINNVIVVFQYFVLGKKHDYLGGLFGVSKGCNAYLYIFLVIITVKSIVYFLNKKETFWLMVSKCGLSLIVAALAELKFFYVQFIIIVAISVLITDFSFRKLSLILVGIIGVIVAVNLLIYIYPYFSDIFSLDALFETASIGGYSAENQVNRLTTIPIISEKFLNSIPQKLFGLGLGNCDTSNFSFLNTEFFEEFSYLRYNWFSTSFMYVENGFVGLIFFFLFFISIFVFSIKRMRISGKHKFYYQISAIMSINAVFIAIYNGSLRMEAGYLVYFMMSFPFILDKYNDFELLNSK